MANTNDLKTSFSWKMLERISAQLVQFVVQIVLARLLTTSDFGNLAITVAISNFAAIFVQSGLSTAIVQKKDLSQEDVDTTFTLSLLISLVLYSVIFVGAPWLQRFYGSDSLAMYIRATALVLIPGAGVAVFTGVLEREMNFKTLFLRSVVIVPISGVIGVFMAYQGFGIWSLIGQLLSNQLLTCLILMIGSKRRIRLRLYPASAKSIFGFSIKILLQALMSELGTSLRSLIIGKRHSVDALAYFDKGATYTFYVYQTIDATVSRVMLPVFSRNQDSPQELRAVLRRSIQLNSFVTVPLLLGFAAVARQFIVIVLTEKWLAAQSFIMLFCVIRLVMIMKNLIIQVYYALGHSGAVLKLQIWDTVLTVALLLITSRIGVIAITVGMIVTELIFGLRISMGVSRLVGYSCKEQMKDIMKPLISGTAMFAAVYSMNLLTWNAWALLAAQILCGGAVYVFFSWLLRNEDLGYLWFQLKEIINRIKIKLGGKNNV